MRHRVALAGAVAAILPGCALIGNLDEFNGAVEARDAAVDSPVSDRSMPHDVASSDVNRGDGTMGDGRTGDGAAPDGASPDGAVDDATVDDVADTAPPGPDPALAPDAATVTCPTQINDAFTVTSPTQTGRHSRGNPTASVCGGPRQTNPGNAADPTNPHFYAVYRFANPTSAAVCFNFTLTYDGAIAPVVDTGSDAGPDAGPDAGSDAGADAGRDAGADAASDAAALDAGADGASDAAAVDAAIEAGPINVPATLQKYMVAYSTFYPTDITSTTYLADVGSVLQPPQTMGVTVPAGETIDVVIEAVGVAPAGVDTFTLTCQTP